MRKECASSAPRPYSARDGCPQGRMPRTHGPICSAMRAHPSFALASASCQRFLLFWLEAARPSLDALDSSSLLLRVNRVALEAMLERRA